MIIDSNLYVGGRIFCNGFSMTAIESYTINDAIITGTMTLCNTAVSGIISFGTTSNEYIAWSNIPFAERPYTQVDGSMVVDSNLYVGGRIFCNGFSMTAIESYTINDAIITGTMTLCNTHVEGVISFGATSNSNYLAWSNIPMDERPYTQVDGSMIIDSNLYVAGRIFCNGFSMTALESYVLNDAIITGTMTLCNTHVEGVVTFGAVVNSNYLAWSNIPMDERPYTQVDGSMVVDSNLYVAGRIFCNGFSMTALESYVLNDAIITGTMTLCNTHVEGVVTFGTVVNSNYLAWSNIPMDERPYTEVDGSLVVDSNLYVAGRIFCNGFSMTAIESYVLNDAIITGTMTLCNTHVEGVVTFGSTSNGNYLAWSNIPMEERPYTEIDGSLVIDSNLYVSGRIFCNGFSMTAMESYVLNDAIITGTMTLCNTHVEGVVTFGTVANSNYLAWSNIPMDERPYTQVDGSMVVDSNLYVAGRIFCNGFSMTAMESYVLNDAIITGTMTLCNTHVEGVVTFGSTSNGNYLAFSNIPMDERPLTEIDGSLMIDSNLYVSGRIFCNGFSMSALDSYTVNDLIVTGTFSLSNIEMNGLFVFGSSNLGYRTWTNIPENEGPYTEIDTSMVVASNMYVGGRLFCNGFTMNATNVFNGTYQNLTVNSNFTVYNGVNIGQNGDVLWKLNSELVPISPSLVSADLVFKCANSNVVTFTEQFDPAILNFTAHHRCSFDNLKHHKKHIGKIVVSTGRYMGLENKKEISINEAIPIVKLCTTDDDSRCFGIISGFEDENRTRDFRIGNIKFTKDKNEKDIKVIVNAAGEGGIWVCNVNGNIKNGDLISSSIIPGYGKKQDDNIVKNSTVAKITCSCNFNLKSKIYKCKEFTYKGKTYRKAFVGCVYKF
jgi:hypothetical protein